MIGIRYSELGIGNLELGGRRRELGILELGIREEGIRGAEFIPGLVALEI